MSTTSQATTTVYINNEPAKQALSDLQDKLNDVNKAKQDAFEKGDFAALKKLDKEAKSLGAEADRLKKRFFDVNLVLKDLSGASANDLGKALRMLQAELNKMRQTDPGFAQKKKQVEDLQKAYDKASISTRSYGKETNGLVGEFKQLLPALGITAIVGGVVSLGKAMFETRKEFQKYEAVLKNTLGSEAASRQAMSMLTKTASELPISLKEATESFIKLANRGMVPTQDEMRRLTDVAMSQGKSLDMFVEAMLDAQTGEFERLKEFGVRAKSEGDKVTFTFKGQTQTVKKTDEAIKAYLLSLGDVEGVAGSSAAVMGTLEGKVSNLGDAWDNMLNNMGKNTQGILNTVIGWLSDFVNTVAIAFQSVEQIKQQVMDEQDLSNYQNAIAEIKLSTELFVKDGMKLKEAEAKAAELYANSMANSINIAKEDLKSATGAQKEKLEKRIASYEKELDAVNGHYKKLKEIELKGLKDANADKNKEFEKQLKDQQKYLEEIIKSGMTLTERENLEYKERLEKAGLFWVTKQSLTREELLKEGKINEKQYQALGILAQQHADNILKITKDWQDKLYNAQADYINALLENMAEGFEQEEAMEVERWEVEKKRLEDKLIDKKVLSDEEVAYNDFVKLTIEEREQAHQDKLKEIRDMAAIEAAEIKVLEAQTEDQEYQAKIQLAQQRYQADFNAANGNRLKELQAQKKYSEEIVALESDKIDKLKEMRQRNLSNVDNYIGILGTMVKKESALGKALFIASKAIAIAKIWVEVAASNAKIMAAANAAAIPTFGASLAAGVALVAENKMQAMLNSGLIAAQTISEVVGHKDGGYTRRDNSNSTPVGIVHANEFVASAPAVDNPTIKPVLDIIDMAQRSGTIRSINLSSVIKRGFQDGGFTSDGSGQTPQSGSGSDQNTLTLAVLAHVINRLIDKLDNLYVKLVMDEFMNELKNYNDMKDDVSK